VSGIEQVPWAPANDLTDGMLDILLARSEISAGDEAAVMVNNLGGTPSMELYIIARRVQQVCVCVFACVCVRASRTRTTGAGGGGGEERAVARDDGGGG
jgi:hypothetical protein